MGATGKIIGGKYVEFANDGRKIVGNIDGGIVFDYEQAINKPSINGVTLIGDKSLGDLGASPLTNMEILEIIIKAES